MVCEINGSLMRKCLLCRDILGTAPDVPAGSKLTVTYGLAVTIGLMRDTYKKEQGSIAAQVLIGAAVPYAYMLLRGAE